MASRFELVLDNSGKFHFHLRGPDGGTLLDSPPFDSKIMAQNAVMHARSALKDAAHVNPEQSASGKHCLVVTSKDGKVLARSPGVETTTALAPMVEGICSVGTVAPIVDLTKRRTSTTNSH